MTFTATRALLAALLLSISCAFAWAAPPATRQWSVNNTSTMSYGTDYELWGKDGQIGYEKRTFGVDLGWVGSSGGHFQFMRETASANVRDHRSGPIGPTEKVAIYSTKHRQWLVYEDRGQWKAGLGWSRTPVYQWRIEDQSASGGRVRFALYNLKVGKYLIYEQKNYGINLGFSATGGPAAQPVQTFSVSMTPQPPVQGWIPYLGSFGQNTRGVLLSVQNSSQNETFLFVKRGRSSNECSNPDAVVQLGPRQTLTAAQMTTLYGSATPALPAVFLACLATPNPQSSGPRFLNITYRLAS